jgi:hypothetical protein
MTIQYQGAFMQELFKELDNDVRSIAVSLAPSPRALAVDPWVASSLLQKSIRRGDADLAERAAITLHRQRGNGIWRRFLIIAFEDVGVASIETLVETAKACSDPAWRSTLGGDGLALRIVARQLASAAKDRSADYLICASRSHPVVEDAWRRIKAMSIAQRLDVLADLSRPLPERAVAAWCASGIEWGDERRVGPGDLISLMHVFRELGVPPELTSATHFAVRRTKEPIVIMTPLLWLASSNYAPVRVVDCAVPPVTMIGETPGYAFDKHTSIGKTAIHRLARKNKAVRDALAAFVSPTKLNDAAAIAAFYADGAPVSRRYDWKGSTELERLGVESDLRRAGITLDGIAPLLTIVRHNLVHLNTLCGQLLGRRADPVR